MSLPPGWALQPCPSYFTPLQSWTRGGAGSTVFTPSGLALPHLQVQSQLYCGPGEVQGPFPRMLRAVRGRGSSLPATGVEGWGRAVLPHLHHHTSNEERDQICAQRILRASSRHHYQEGQLYRVVQEGTRFTERGLYLCLQIARFLNVYLLIFKFYRIFFDNFILV